MGRPKLTKRRKAENAYKRNREKMRDKWTIGGPSKWCVGKKRKLKHKNGSSKCASYRQGARKRMITIKEKWLALDALLREDHKTRKNQKKNKTHRAMKQPRAPGNNGAGKTLIKRAIQGVASGKQPTKAQEEAAKTVIRKGDVVLFTPGKTIMERGIRRIAAGELPTDAQQQAAQEALDNMSLSETF